MAVRQVGSLDLRVLRQPPHGRACVDKNKTSPERNVAVMV